MSTDELLAERIRSALGELGDEAGNAPAIDELMVPRAGHVVAVGPERSSIARQLMLAAAIVLVAGLAWFAVAGPGGDAEDDTITDTPDVEDVDDTETPAPPLFDDVDEVIEAGLAEGFTMTTVPAPGTDRFEPVLEGTPQPICVNGGWVHVLVYDTAEAASAEVERLGADGQLVDGESFDWLGRANLHQAGAVVALHVGEPSATTAALSDLFGANLTPDAGPGRFDGYTASGCHPVGDSITTLDALRLSTSLMNTTGRTDLSLLDTLAIGNALCGPGIDGVDAVRAVADDWQLDVFNDVTGDPVTRTLWSSARTMCLDRFTPEAAASPGPEGGSSGGNTRAFEQSLGVPDELAPFANLDILEHDDWRGEPGVSWGINAVVTVGPEEAVAQILATLDDRWTPTVVGPVALPEWNTEVYAEHRSIDLDSDSWTGDIRFISGLSPDDGEPQNFVIISLVNLD